MRVPGSRKSIGNLARQPHRPSCRPSHTLRIITPGSFIIMDAPERRAHPGTFERGSPDRLHRLGRAQLTQAGVEATDKKADK